MKPINLVRLLLCISPFYAVSIAAPTETKEMKGKIIAVTIYQGSALVTREIVLPAGKTGAFEIIVSPLPSSTETTSVYAEEHEGVEVRSVSCRTRATQEEKKRETQVSTLEKKIKLLERKVRSSRNEIALRRIRQQFLKNLGGFVAPAARQEMKHGVIQADEIEKVTQMHFREYEKASQEIMKYDLSILDDNIELDLMRGERKKLVSGPPLAYDAIIFLEKRTAKAVTIKLNYLVRDCNWSPVYNMRGHSKGNTVDILFNAIIQQVSGEDWKNCQLTLSTASPTVSAYNPDLTPLYVQVSSSAGQQNNSDKASMYKRSIASKKAAVIGQMRGKSLKETAAANFQANEFATSIQLIELSERLSLLRQLNQSHDSDDLSIQYKIKVPVSLISRRDSQMVPVLKHTSKADFYYVATPILTTSVFREAELVNQSDSALLGGRVNIYLDGEFIGRTDIPTIAQGRSYTLGFGADGQLRARRSLVNRNEAVQGGNRRITINSEIVIDNYKTEPVSLRLYERMPYTEDSETLRVGLENTSRELSKDPEYKRFELDKGILRWDLLVKPGTGQKATNVSYAYSLEFDKSLKLGEISNARKSRLKTDFLKRSKRAAIREKPMLLK